MEKYPFSEIFTENQWRYIKLWLVTIILAEAAMFVLNEHLPAIYLAISAVFFVGVTLRVLGLYPGSKEPLVLDASAVLIALIMSCIAKLLGSSGWRFLLILTSSVIVMPHLLYIISKDDII